MPDLLSPDYLPPMRVDGRSSMRQLVDKAVSHLESVPDARLLDSNFHSAYRLMSSATAREAFDLSQGDRRDQGALRPQPLRHELPAGAAAWSSAACGSSPSTCSRRSSTRSRGTSTARRRSARSAATATWSGRCSTTPTASLLEDLHERGLLHEHAGPRDGRVRPHAEGQPRRRPRPLAATAGPSLMGGGGIKGGQVIGASDEIGGYPKDRPISPPEVAATIYKALGIDIETAAHRGGEPSRARRGLRPSRRSMSCSAGSTDDVSRRVRLLAACSCSHGRAVVSARSHARIPPATLVDPARRHRPARAGAAGSSSSWRRASARRTSRPTAGATFTSVEPERRDGGRRRGRVGGGRRARVDHRAGRRADDVDDRGSRARGRAVSADVPQPRRSRS